MSNRNDLLYIKDILDSANAIEQYVKGMEFSEFIEDRKTFAATIREFEIIGEAVGKISGTIKNRYDDINWQDIKALRNILIHEYFGVDAEIIWNTIKNDLPKLRKAAIKIFEELN